ncbi:MAG: hypothetical protein H0X72_21445 [Acidobacteria bacterium]|jgi:hypothetical protein|nr:hypothetical protein [Acidobacteriota bacterium]
MRNLIRYNTKFAASRWQRGNCTSLESNRTIRFGSLVTVLLKINNFGGEVLAPFGVNSNGREGKLGVVKITLTDGKVATAAAVKIKAAANNSMDVRAKQRLCYSACLFSLTLRGGGFAPRHLNRSISRVGEVKIREHFDLLEIR